MRRAAAAGGSVGDDDRRNERLAWLTELGDSRDHVLEAGARFRVASRAVVVVHALPATRLELAAPAGARRLPARAFPRFLGWLGNRALNPISS